MFRKPTPTELEFLAAVRKLKPDAVRRFFAPDAKEKVSVNVTTDYGTNSALALMILEIARRSGKPDENLSPYIAMANFLIQQGAEVNTVVYPTQDSKDAMLGFAMLVATYVANPNAELKALIMNLSVAGAHPFKAFPAGTKHAFQIISESKLPPEEKNALIEQLTGNFVKREFGGEVVDLQRVTVALPFGKEKLLARVHAELKANERIRSVIFTVENPPPDAKDAVSVAEWNAVLAASLAKPQLDSLDVVASPLTSPDLKPYEASLFNGVLDKPSLTSVSIEGLTLDDTKKLVTHLEMKTPIRKLSLGSNWDTDDFRSILQLCKKVRLLHLYGDLLGQLGRAQAEDFVAILENADVDVQFHRFGSVEHGAIMRKMMDFNRQDRLRKEPGSWSGLFEIGKILVGRLTRKVRTISDTKITEGRYAEAAIALSILPLIKVSVRDVLGIPIGLDRTIYYLKSIMPEVLQKACKFLKVKDVDGKEHLEVKVNNPALQLVWDAIKLELNRTDHPFLVPAFATQAETDVKGTDSKAVDKTVNVRSLHDRILDPKQLTARIALFDAEKRRELEDRMKTELRGEFGKLLTKFKPIFLNESKRFEAALRSPSLRVDDMSVDQLFTLTAEMIAHATQESQKLAEHLPSITDEDVAQFTSLNPDFVVPKMDVAEPNRNLLSEYYVSLLGATARYVCTAPDQKFSLEFVGQFDPVVRVYNVIKDMKDEIGEISIAALFRPDFMICIFKYKENVDTLVSLLTLLIQKNLFNPDFFLNEVYALQNPVIARFILKVNPEWIDGDIFQLIYTYHKDMEMISRAYDKQPPKAKEDLVKLLTDPAVAREILGLAADAKDRPVGAAADAKGQSVAAADSPMFTAQHAPASGASAAATATPAAAPASSAAAATATATATASPPSAKR